MSLVPEVYIGGSNGTDGDGGATSSIDTLAKIMTMNLVQNADETDSVK